MKQPIRLLLILSASALFASACSTAPYDETAGSGSTDSMFASGGSNGSGNIPEAGPLTEVNNYVAAPANTYQPPAPAPVDNQYAYVQPQAQPDMGYDSYAGSGYDNVATNPAPEYAAPANTYAAPAPTTGGYDYSAPGSDSYNSYGGANAAPADPYAAGGNDYYSGGNTGGSGGQSYAATSGASSGGGGGAAVQVFASGSIAKAEQIMRSIQGRGLPAVVDPVAGLYKVRVPFSSESEARANLARVRSASGESGAFVTFR